MANNYEALTAKCRAMMGDLLTENNYTELESKKTIAEAALYLQSFAPYSKNIMREDVTKLTRAKVETLLEESLLDTYIKLYNFSSLDHKKFFLYLIAEFELNYILKVVRAFMSGQPLREIHVPVFLRRHFKTNFGAMMAANAVEDIVYSVKGSDFCPAITAHLSPESADYALFETALYNYYYGAMFKKYSASLTKSDAEVLRGLLALKADFSNISKIIRFVRLWEGTATAHPGYDEVKQYLITVRNKLRPSDIAALLKKTGASEIIEYCASLYPRLKSHVSESTVTSDGNYFSNFNNQVAKKTPYRSRPSLLTPYAYLTLREYETYNIVYVVEAIRYSVAPASIHKSLII
jgi:Archaeal/vacuolar-type H+-ATPase subunit C